MKRQATGWKQISAKDKKNIWNILKTLKLKSCFKKSTSKMGKRYEETFTGEDVLQRTS